MRSLGYGKDYKYAHDYEAHFAGQHNLPEEIADKRFYEPGGEGYERTVRERIKAWWGNTKSNSP